jgi:endonuclease-3
MSKRRNQQPIAEILRRLREAYPEVVCALDHRDPFELLAATILSAQCTDERVNMVTPVLFARYPTPAALAAADQPDVEEIIRSTGFFRNKSKNLIGMARHLAEHHDGQVPRTLEQLIELPGVARKTANVVLGTGFGIASGVVVDTHVSRLGRLLGLTQHTDPVKIERDLVALLPKEEWIDFSHRLIFHGRQVCIARRPACDRCTLSSLCPSAGLTGANEKKPALRKNEQQGG